MARVIAPLHAVCVCVLSLELAAEEADEEGDEKAGEMAEGVEEDDGPYLLFIGCIICIDVQCAVTNTMQ